MNIVRPNGLIEKMTDRQQRSGGLSRYGREKDGAPKDSRSWKIARDNDRRQHGRQKDAPLRGRLIDLNA